MDGQPNVLAPNYLGDSLGNRGVSEMIANQGLGVAEAMSPSPNKQAIAQRSAGEPANSEIARNKLRVASAREFGKNKEEVGF